jgi:hypothetical protein
VWVAAETLLWSSVAIGAFEVVQRPRHVLCDCPVLTVSYLHLRSGMLFVKAAMTSGVSVLWTMEHVGVSVPALAMGGLAAWEWWRWWRHSRDGRRRLKDRVLGVVREMGGRLVVEPVPG